MSLLHARLDKRRWAAARRACFERDGHRCRDCGVAGRLEAHHSHALEAGGSPFDLDNLETLCRPCHIQRHGRQESPEQRAWRDLVRELA